MTYKCLITVIMLACQEIELVIVHLKCTWFLISLLLIRSQRQKSSHLAVKL